MCFLLNSIKTFSVLRARWLQRAGERSPVYSPRIIRDIITVKMGAELFTVSANETATFFRLTRPNTTVANLERSRKGGRDGRVRRWLSADSAGRQPGATPDPARALLGPALTHLQGPMWPERGPRRRPVTLTHDYLSAGAAAERTHRAPSPQSQGHVLP